MFKKVAEYYRQGKTGQGLKLLKKILLDFAKEDRLLDEARKSSPLKSEQKKEKTTKKKTIA